jgi:hypothetical protein
MFQFTTNGSGLSSSTGFLARVLMTPARLAAAMIVDGIGEKLTFNMLDFAR